MYCQCLQLDTVPPTFVSYKSVLSSTLQIKMTKNIHLSNRRRESMHSSIGVAEQLVKYLLYEDRSVFVELMSKHRTLT